MRIARIMKDSFDCILEAENLALAAMAARSEEARCTLIRLSAHFRNEALRMKLGRRATVLDRDHTPSGHVRF